jgi:5,10-methylenetetrahydromethanopterin reductase
MRLGVMDMTVNYGSTSDVASAVSDAVAIGAASFWAPNFFGLDCLTALAIAGAHVPEIHLGTAVVPIFGRHPRVLAQQALSVHAGIGERLTLGVGLSHRAMVDGLIEPWPQSPVGYLERYLEQLIPMCASHDDADVGGASDLHIRIDHRLPVVVAALGPKTLAVAGALSDGVVLWCVGANTIAQVTAPQLEAAASMAGRPPPRIVAAVPVCVTREPHSVRSAIERKFRAFDALPSYRASLEREGVGSIGELAVVGDRSEVIDGIDRFRQAGVTEFLWNDASSTPSEREANRMLLAEILADEV